MKLSTTQNDLLNLLKKKKGNVEEISLRDIGAEINMGKGNKYDVNPQLVAHHLGQLEKKGYIRRLSPGKRVYNVLKEPVDDVVYVKLYNVTAQCGPDGLLGEDSVKEEIPLHSRTFGISNPDHYFLIKAKGDSMEPQIHSGDLILAKIQTSLEANEIGIVVNDDQPKIKKLVKIGDRSGLMSLNNKYPIESIAEDFRVIGKVKTIIRNGL